MKPMTKTVIVAAALLTALPGWSAEMKINEDRVAIVDGTPTFILGLYENPTDDAALKAAVDAGINLVYASPTTESLDRLHGAGTHAWLNTGYDIDLSEDRDAKQERLAKTVEALAGHPALLVWEVPDEALWNAWYLAEGWRFVDERKQQGAAIGELSDNVLADKLTADVAEANRLYRHGQYAEGEALADSVWTALDKDIPQPGYGLSTAPERAAKMGAGMLEGYQALRKLDPAHPVWMNHAPRNTIEDLAYFDRAADIVGCDIYPVPESPLARHSDLANRTLSSVGAYTNRMQEAAPGKPVWMVLQGTSWADFQTGHTPEELKVLRRPRKDETRFMAYDAIVHGARGILYWGTQFVEKDSQFWLEMLEVVKELNGLQHVLTAPDSQATPTISVGPTHGSVDRGIVTLSKKTPEGDWHIVVNEFEGPLVVTLADLKGAYRIQGEELPLALDGGKAVLPMVAYGVCVLEPIQ